MKIIGGYSLEAVREQLHRAENGSILFPSGPGPEDIARELPPHEAEVLRVLAMLDDDSAVTIQQLCDLCMQRVRDVVDALDDLALRELEVEDPEDHTFRPTDFGREVARATLGLAA
ncbi:MAG: hypothetical protein R3346_04520 [Candidatus Spechtbacterales bacterium]|nr:hypothetical protein [Candidatus Spechtbacterales bacterium]